MKCENTSVMLSIKPIAYIHSDFSEKFGIPRQSGLVDSLQAKIIFTEEFRNGDCIRGIEEFSHLWLIWEFSKNQRDKWTPTVRPPRLGGNKRKGVFASRAPFRPNPLGFSCNPCNKGTIYDTSVIQCTGKFPGSYGNVFQCSEHICKLETDKFHVFLLSHL